MNEGLALAAFGSTAIAVFLFVYSQSGLLRRWAGAKVDSTASEYRDWSREMLLDWSEPRMRRWALIARTAVPAAAFVVLLLSRSVVFAALAAVAAWALPRLWFIRRRDRHVSRLELQLADAVDVMVASVRSGQSLPNAIEDVSRKMPSPIAGEFALIAREHRLGGASIEEALERASRRLDLEMFTMVATACGVASRHGGDLLHILERLADAIRSLTRLKAKLITETSEVRAQETVIVGLTPVFLIGICLYDPAIPSILFGTVSGNVLLVSVVVLEVVGTMVIRSIIRSTI
jgi:tight adherence protein B